MNNNKKQNKRKQIFDAAIEVFASKGYHVATMQDIADEAEMAVGTIYNYFKNKDDVMLSLFELKWEEFNSGMENIRKESISEREKFFKHNEFMMNYFEQDNKLILILFVQMSSLLFTENPPVELKKLKSKVLQTIANELKIKRDSGLINFEGDINTIAHIYFGAIQGFFIKTMIEQDGITKTDRETFLEFTTNGLKFKFEEDNDEK